MKEKYHILCLFLSWSFSLDVAQGHMSSLVNLEIANVKGQEIILLLLLLIILII